MALFRAQHDFTECVTTAVDTVLHVAEPDIELLVITYVLCHMYTTVSGES